MYIMSYYQAGGNNRGSSFSTNIGSVYFKNKIDFNFIRKTAKDMLESTLKNGCPCPADMSVYFHIVKVKNDEVIASVTGDFKSLNIIKWHN